MKRIGYAEDGYPGDDREPHDPVPGWILLAVASLLGGSVLLYLWLNS